ncbi:type II toxin-antitoxin system VapC family toxin [Thauera sp. Sel9]|uniref:type II toxin-antitoxin system VapC family toxin n=1 Tax=Thauera sp. Sel9 TaxID=2974299 RepID=UPI0021E18730|nr:PIN domain-containing protein [Thauera sp. Sel9]MCV2219005.1 PIN domain-containing protein [Thauera sp. Sel9]
MNGVLVDTSVWVAHFRQSNPVLAELAAVEAILTHPLVRGEIACGTPPRRTAVLADLALLATPRLATLDEVIDFIEREKLHGLGCSVVDLTLLASVLLTPGVALWTLDRRLLALAKRFGLAWQPKRH